MSESSIRIITDKGSTANDSTLTLTGGSQVAIWRARQGCQLPLSTDTIKGKSMLIEQTISPPLLRRRRERVRFIRTYLSEPSPHASSLDHISEASGWVSLGCLANRGIYPNLALATNRKKRGYLRFDRSRLGSAGSRAGREERQVPLPEKHYIYRSSARATARRFDIDSDGVDVFFFVRGCRTEPPRY